MGPMPGLAVLPVAKTTEVLKTRLAIESVAAACTKLEPSSNVPSGWLPNTMSRARFVWPIDVLIGNSNFAAVSAPGGGGGFGVTVIRLGSKTSLPLICTLWMGRPWQALPVTVVG